MLKINQEKIANKLEFGYAFWMHMPCKKFATIQGNSTMHEVKSNLQDLFW